MEEGSPRGFFVFVSFILNMGSGYVSACYIILDAVFLI